MSNPGRRRSLLALDPRWVVVREKLRRTPHASDHPNVYFVDVEATRLTGVRGAYRLFSASFLAANAERVDVRSRITYDNPELTNGPDRLDFTVDHGTSIQEALSQTPISGSWSGLRWVARQYGSPANGATWGLKKAEVAQNLGQIGLTRASRDRDIMIARTETDYDRAVLAELPNCDDILPASIDPSRLLTGLGWKSNTSLEAAFLAVTMGDEENREYHRALDKIHHLPWIDNEMARIVVRELLEYYE